MNASLNFSGAQPTETPAHSLPTACAKPGGCESVWECQRGRTRLCCQLDTHADGVHRLTLLRNSRTYGEYAFSGRDAALTFASRLRHTFAGNGWAAS